MENIGELTQSIFNALPFGCKAVENLQELESLVVSLRAELVRVKDTLRSTELDFEDYKRSKEDCLNYLTAENKRIQSLVDAEMESNHRLAAKELEQTNEIERLKAELEKKS